MNNRSICIVSTQMQLLNCVELLYDLERSSNELLIIAQTNDRKKQIMEVIEKCNYYSSFSSITVIEPCYKNKYEVLNSFLFKRKIKKYFKKNGQFDTIILCNYKTVFVRYAYYCIWKKTPHIKTFVIDDGMSIIEIIKRRKEEIETQHSSIEIVSRHFYLVFPFIRMRKCIAPSLIFFTNHNIKVFEERDSIIKNEYVHLKESLIQDTDNNNEVKLCIIGQPLVQAGLLEEKKYNYWIEKFADKCCKPDDSILYIPHPAENLDNKTIGTCKQNLTIKPLDWPIEVFALSLNSHTIIVGFYSAALFNIHMMRPDLRIYCLYPFNSDSLDTEKKVRLDAAYSTLSSSGIEIIREI